MIRFDIRCQLDYQVDGQSELMFNIQPAHTLQQAVDSESIAWTGVNDVASFSDPGLGNRMLKTSVASGLVRVDYNARVSIAHHVAHPRDIEEVPVGSLAPEILPYLLPTRYCESDQLSAFAQSQFGHLPRGYSRVQAVCDWVHGHVRFAPGASDSWTSATGTLRSGAGVCRDFAHLTIALLRALNIPARFVAGYDYGADPALGPTDFHAYVEAFLRDRWYIFDASRICPRKGLVRIGTGYDAADVAFATIYGPTRFLGMKLDIEPFDLRGRALAVTDDPGVAISTASLADMLPVVTNALVLRTMAA
ncbi:hypothetical protein BWI17_04750 [Betaproteobacteria bacterium GR16-43]|nr:hypothetical protein BWI17_04750 [Betaproteobacteria bacterium GR16-43]